MQALNPMAISPDTLLDSERREAMRALPWVFVSFCGVVIGLALTFLVMRALMAIGGSCASGGPYVSARQCPDVTWLMPVGIVGGMPLGLIYVFKKPARAPSFVSLLWPALFLSIGWNFLEFGLAPPGRKRLDWGWLVCAFVFALMGGVPLVWLLASGPRTYLRRMFWGVTEPLISPPGFPPQGAHFANLLGEPRPQPRAEPPPPRAQPSPEEALVAALERLERLHRSGSLTDDEFAAAKRRLLEGKANP